MPRTRWTSFPMSPERAQQISQWQYAPPHDIYGTISVYNLMHGSYTACFLDDEAGDAGGQKQPAGFYCVGRAAQTAEAEGLYSLHPDDVDLGMALRPDLLGQGLGLSLAEHALSRIGHHAGVRLAVFEWNTAALRIYERAGFAAAARFGAVILMRREGWLWQDATRSLTNNMAVYPGDPPFTRTVSEQSGFNVTALSMTAHNGTHIDGRCHVAGLEGGADAWPLETLNGAVRIMALPDAPQAQARMLRDARLPRRVLFKSSGNALGLEAARALAEAGVELVGIDQLSVGARECVLHVHRTLLEAGAALLEGLYLEPFTEGWHFLRCLPMLLPGCDGAPVRALLKPIPAYGPF